MNKAILSQEKTVLQWELTLNGAPAAAENCHLKGCILDKERKKKKERTQADICCFFVIMLAILLISSAVLTFATSFCFHVSVHSNHIWSMTTTLPM
jgi:hypothetical protein